MPTNAEIEILLPSADEVALLARCTLLARAWTMVSAPEHTDCSEFLAVYTELKAVSAEVDVLLAVKGIPRRLRWA